MKHINRHGILTTSIALALFAADKGGGTATATAPTTAAASPKPTTDGGAKTKAQPEAKVHDELLVKMKAYDEATQKAESYYIEIIKIIQLQKISRADVVATMMRARSITFEAAQSQYSRMKGVWQNPEVLGQLERGEITLRMAREKTTKKQAATEQKAAGTANTPGSGGEKESKESRYDRVRKAHVAAVKECGFDKKSAMLSFEADLNAAGIK